MQNNLTEKGEKIKANAKKLVNFSFLSFFFIFLISFSSASIQVGLDSSLNEIGINFDRTPFNISEQAVNTSDYWLTNIGALGNVNSTQFSNQGGVLNIIESWVDSLWCRLTGCTMSGDIDLGGNDLTNVNVGYFNNLSVSKNISIGNRGNLIHTPESLYAVNTTGAMRFYANVSNPSNIAYMFCAENPGGTCLPRFIIQRGGTGLGSMMVRSMGIISDDVSWLNGTASNGIPTNLSGYLAYVGEDQKIDFATDISGADLYVGDDLQVGGDVWLKNTRSEWKFLSRVLTLLDEQNSNTVINRISGNIVGDNLTISEFHGEGETIVININETEIITNKTTDSIILTLGTNSSPQFNHIYYSDASNPTITKSTSPQTDVPDIAQILIGNSYIYGSIIGSSSGEDFVRGVYHRFYSQGAVYESGFTPTINSSSVSLATGNFLVLLDTHSVSNVVDTAEYFYNLNNETFIQASSIDSIEQYSDGGTIGNNKYFSVIFGITQVDNGVDGRLMAIVQDEPSTEYSNLQNAEVDTQNKALLFPSDSFLKKIYVPIARVVMQRSGSTNSIQTLSNGNLFFDLRGQTGISGGSPPSPSITDHDALNNLDFASSGHTNFLSDFGDTAVGNYNFTSGNFSIDDNFFYDNLTGNVGIGTSSPSEALDVTGIIQASSSIKSGHDVFIGTNRLLRYTPAASNSLARIMFGDIAGTGGDFAFIRSADSAEIMRLQADGNVGIGDSSPTSPLTVVKNTGTNSVPIASFGTTQADDYGIMEIDSGGDNNYRPSTLRFKEGGNLKWEIGGAYQLADDSFGIRDGAGNYRMVIEEAGNVGIGTTSPDGVLEVSNAGQLTIGNLVLTDAHIAGGAHTVLSFKTSDSVEGDFTNGGINTISNDLILFATDDLFLSGGGANQDQLTVTNLGRVGIGTGNPPSPLTVYENTASTSGAGLTIINDGSGDARVRYNIGATAYWAAGIDNSAGDSFKFAASSGLGTSDILTITRTGNVGIGTTTPDFKLQVNGTIAPEINATYDLGTADLAWNNVYAVTYNDLTPAWTDSDGSALDAIMAIKNEGDEINHTSYPQKLRSKFFTIREIEQRIRQVPTGSQIINTTEQICTNETVMVEQITQELSCEWQQIGEDWQNVCVNENVSNQVLELSCTDNFNDVCSYEEINNSGKFSKTCESVNSPICTVVTEEVCIDIITSTNTTIYTNESYDVLIPKEIRVDESLTLKQQEDFVKSELSLSDEDIVKTEVKYTRDIGGTITMLVEAVKELFGFNEIQDTRLDNLEVENGMLKSELCKKDNSYSWC